MGPVTSWMGDRLGIPGAERHFCPFLFIFPRFLSGFRCVLATNAQRRPVQTYRTGFQLSKSTGESLDHS